MAINLPLKSSTTLFSSQETLRNSEAREWIQRHKTKVKELGANGARKWWVMTIDDIQRKRGISAVDDLRRRMNIERNK
ncbi:hypothetical protein UFOVP1463_42 [uncultured Caudovirales phage]|uniref:Uncharacterized protein n=1 Tax=uncultured Caudovirales phage TaxID=2100421 RepID=A0A6J5SJ96_9CAUD|nr:hypothetical protein UFOVP1102_31 [uncultured Caudovirales phage]CAB4214375.1 hypothetical protein UFOVP1463_42 [uncultured Caudovirales phage]